MKVVAVVQARMGSTRLPGKVLKKLGNKAAIEWAVAAAWRATGVDKVVVATSTAPENDALANHPFGERVFVPQIVRGSENNVLDRYRQVIDETGADVIVRLTADCPLLDSRVISEVIGLYKANPKCAYASNTDPPTWPDGLDCEVISAEALRIAAEDAVRPSDRDTVTRYIARNRHSFPSQTLICPIKGMHKERWVLDSQEDYEFLQKVFREFVPEWEPNYLDVLELLRRKPELRELTGSYTRNQRFFEALSVEPVIRKKFPMSDNLFDKAKHRIPFAAQTFSKSHLQYPKGSPLFLSHGDGGYAFDVDGNEYVDMVSALLPNVLGYCDPDVDYAIRHQMTNGISFSLSTELEQQVAKKLALHIPCAEMVKFGKNGSDVTSAAVRVARAFTGRRKVAVMAGGYHGWTDWAVANTSRDIGVSENTKKDTVRVSGDLQALRGALATKKYAAVILEPEGRRQPYLLKLQELAAEYGTLLIFDEVITGFRWHLGGYQAHIGVTPDLATFGKAMGNGMPISALVGAEDIMRRFEPPDNVFYSGTFFGETLSLAAALATIEKMEKEPVISHLWNVGSKLRDTAMGVITAAGLDGMIQIGGDGPLARVTFHGGQGLDADQVAGLYRKYMIESGTLIAASHNVCYAHGPSEVIRVIKSYEYMTEQMNLAIKRRDTVSHMAVAAGVR